MRDAMKLYDIKRRIEWPLMIAALGTLFCFGAVGCAETPLGPNVDRVQPVEISEQEMDAGQRAQERQRNKNARNNGQATEQ